MYITTQLHKNTTHQKTKQQHTDKNTNNINNAKKTNRKQENKTVKACFKKKTSVRVASGFELLYHILQFVMHF